MGHPHTMAWLPQLTMAKGPNWPWCDGVSARAAITTHHRQGGLNSRHLFSHDSGGWKSEISVPAWSGSREGHLLSCHMAFAQDKCGQGELSGVSSHEATNPVRLGPHPHDLIQPQLFLKSPSTDTRIGGRASPYEFGRTQFSPWQGVMSPRLCIVFPGLS